MADITIVAGDNRPSILADLFSDPAGQTPFNLTNFTATVSISINGRTKPIVGQMVVVTPSPAQVRYDWADGDTGVAGTGTAQIQVTNALTGERWTFPLSGSVTIGGVLKTGGSLSVEIVPRVG